MSEDCGCDKALRELEELLHHELCAEDESDVRAHLDGCESCSEELRVNACLLEAVQRACRERAPETLRRQVLEAVRRAHQRR